MKKITKVEYDLTLLTLIILGLIVLFTASSYYAALKQGSIFYFVRKQAFLYLIGYTFYCLCARVSLEKIRYFTPLFLLLALVLNVLTYVDVFAQNIRGAQRWLKIAGVSFQPSEMMKIGLVLYLAHILDSRQSHFDKFEKKPWKAMVLIVILLALVYGQNDFSSTAFLGMIVLVMLFVGHVKKRYFVIMLITSVLLGSLMISTVAFRVGRLDSYLGGLFNTSSISYQLKGAYTALNAGSFWGVGLGNGRVKNGGIAVAESDFIIAAFGEEFGFIGITALILVNMIFCYRLTAALKEKNLYSWYLGFGIVATYFMQILINLSVVVGLVPTTGIPFPFLSAGGSASVLFLLSFGILRKVLFSDDIEIGLPWQEKTVQAEPQEQLEFSNVASSD